MWNIAPCIHIVVQYSHLSTPPACPNKLLGLIYVHTSYMYCSDVHASNMLHGDAILPCLAQACWCFLDKVNSTSFIIVSSLSLRVPPTSTADTLSPWDCDSSSIPPSLPSPQLALLLFEIVMLVVHCLSKPYEKKWINIVEALILLDLFVATAAILQLQDRYVPRWLIGVVVALPFVYGAAVGTFLVVKYSWWGGLHRGCAHSNSLTRYDIEAVH